MRNQRVILLAAAISQACAQISSSSMMMPPTMTPGPVYVTETLSTCESDTPETLVTVTQATTVNYCPRCDPRTTVYTTVYQSLCTTDPQWSMMPVTHTITEVCPGACPTGSTHIPPGYTVTTRNCDKCATPGPVTYTEKCGCDATEGVPAPTPSPGEGGAGGDGGRGGDGGAGGPGGYGGAGGDGGDGGAGGAGGAGGPGGAGGRGGDGGDGGAGGAGSAGGAGGKGGDGGSGGAGEPGGAGKAPYPAQTGAKKYAPSAMPAPTHGNTSHIMLYKGTASSFSAGAVGFSSLAAVFVGALALFL